MHIELATKWKLAGFFRRLSLGCLVLILLLGSIVLSTPTEAAMRLQERMLYMNSSVPGAVTFHKISFQYMSSLPVGSVEFLFCNNPIPYTNCVVPTNMTAASAVLTDQSGEVGFSLTAKSINRLVISRTASTPINHLSSYTFDGIKNPTDTGEAFSIRIRTFTSTDASGQEVDFGSVRGQVTDGVVIETQVPPMLIFCLAEQVDYNCTGTNETFYKNMGELSPGETLTAQSQMAVGTNASGGFVITAVGAPMSAGTDIIPSMSTPGPSQVGKNQFGFNLVANTFPEVGSDPEGGWTNALVSADYNTRNQYTFRSGDIVAYSPNVSLMKKYTVSYIVNSEKDLRAGVYTTTINFIASGRF